MILVTRISDDYWFDFENDITNVNTLFKKYGAFKFLKNSYFNDNVSEMLLDWEDLTKEQAEKITQCKYEIVIFDYENLE